MFFREKMPLATVAKWAMVAGFFEGAWLAIARILWRQVGGFTTLADGERSLAIVFLVVVAISAVFTTVIILAHPIYSLLKKQYVDAWLTLAVAAVTASLVYLILPVLYLHLI